MDEQEGLAVAWQGPERLDQAGANRLVELLAAGLERLLLDQAAKTARPTAAVDLTRDLCVYTDHGEQDVVDDDG